VTAHGEQIAPPPGAAKRARRRVAGLPSTLVWGGTITLAWIVVALAAPLLAPYDPNAHNMMAILQPPGLAHPLGTDNFGRDILSRIIFGTRIDLAMGLIGVLLPFVIGTTIGAVAGFFGGLADTVLMRLLDVVLAFPWLVLLMAIIAILEPGLGSFFIAVALVGWVSYARLVRSRVLVLKGADFVTAGRCLGYGPGRLLVRHILPNAMAPALVFAMSDVVLVILAGAAISYLGLGVQPPTAEWGVMIAEGQTFIFTAWWICTFPGVALVLLALGFSLLADGLADLLGVKR
jgi:peptide/nickel transport system permease protein